MSYDESSFLAGLTTGISIHGWACVKMNDNEATYVISEPVEFTLLASDWTSTTYTLKIEGYTVEERVQIGLPAISVASNTQAVIEAALTIPQVVVGENGGTIYISAIQRPSKDLKIAIFGLTSKGGKIHTVVAPEIYSTTTARISDPDTAYPTKTDCTVNGSNGWDYNSYLLYDISAIPVGSTIVSANIYVYCNNWNDNAASSRHNIVRVTESWGAETTWNNAPNTANTMYLSEDMPPPALNSWGSWDITQLVQEWVDGTYPNYGLMFYTNQSGEQRYNWSFYNRQYNEGEYATYINIVYESSETE